ncbi:ATP-binding protein [Streptomyces sp. NPDC012825]|uniref:ATP-binding protein n=1 Tax=Streptomyces sp. NPDC012825 TaxID=3364851 RepID=UPI0036CE038B
MDMMSVDVVSGRLPGSIAAARDSTRHFLEGLVPSLTPEAAETVVLVVSELVTNALRHGGGTCALVLATGPNGIEVAVHDSSPHVPRVRTPDLNGGAGGFGWPMITRLSTSTAVTRRADGGKTVTALLPC